MENICIIPLRSKSKGLKNKNIKLLNKLPLCIYSIKVAIESKIFKKIFIAIDDVKYEIIISSYIKKLKINKSTGSVARIPFCFYKEIVNNFRLLEWQEIRFYSRLFFSQPL